MLYVDYIARTQGNSTVPVVVQLIVRQQARHLGSRDDCVLRPEDKIYFERHDGSLRVVIYGNSPDRSTEANCTP